MQTLNASARGLSRLITAAGLVWLVFIGWRTYAGWPVVPLDININDPGVSAAHQAALFAHVLHAVEFAVLGIGIAAGLVWLVRRRARPSV